MDAGASKPYRTRATSSGCRRSMPSIIVRLSKVIRMPRPKSVEAASKYGGPPGTRFAASCGRELCCLERQPEVLATPVITAPIHASSRLPCAALQSRRLFRSGLTLSRRSTFWLTGGGAICLRLPSQHPLAFAMMSCYAPCLLTPLAWRTMSRPDQVCKTYHQ